MKRFYLFFLLLFTLNGCLQDDNSFDPPESISEEIVLTRGDEIEKPCPLEIIPDGVDRNGCCKYKVCYTPRKRGNYSLRSRGQLLNGVITIKGKYIWNVTVCENEEIEICLIRTTIKFPQVSQIVCCKTLTCEPQVVDCNINVTIDDLGVDEYGDCTYKICVDQIIDSKKAACGYTLSIDGVDQGSSIKCCWIISVASGETVLIEIFNSDGDLCYQEEITCEENCCSNLGFEVCYAERELDCYQFQFTLTPSDCTDVISVTVNDKRGDARLLSLSNNIATIEACITDETTEEFNVGVNVIFYTEECGTFTTGFFYPVVEHQNGEMDDCF